MRHTIDKQTYNYLFGILLFFVGILSLISIFLMIDLGGFAPKTLTFSSSLLFLLIGVSVWLRIEYLKHYNFFVYKTRRIPMWFSAAAAFGAGVMILI